MTVRKEQKRQARARRLAREANLRAHARRKRRLASLTVAVAAIVLAGGAVVGTEGGAIVATTAGAVAGEGGAVAGEDGAVVATEGVEDHTDPLAPPADHTDPVAPAPARVLAPDSAPGNLKPTVLLRYIVLCRVIRTTPSTTNCPAPSKARRSPGAGS